MGTRLEYLLSLVSPKSVMPMAPGHVPGTTKPVVEGLEALAELSFACHGKQRLPVISALLRWAPDRLTRDDWKELKARLTDHLIVYALTQQPRLSDKKLPKAVMRAAYCAMNEHMDYSPCPLCNGKRRIMQRSEAGTGVTDVRCPRCHGAGSLSWTKDRRAQFLGIPRRTAYHCRLELVNAGVSLLANWELEGMDAVNRMRAA